MQLAYNFDVSSSYPIFLLVLWVLGACMIVLAALVWLPITWLAVFSVATIVLHHLLDGVQVWHAGAPGQRVPGRRPDGDCAVHAGAVVCRDGAGLLPGADLQPRAAKNDDAT